VGKRGRITIIYTLEYRSGWKVESVELNKLVNGFAVNGFAVKRPYEVDVYAVLVGRGWFDLPVGRPRIRVWIECKDRKSSVKRADIAKLDSAACDVLEANERGSEETNFNHWMLVSPSPFDSDAIKYATENNINCVWHNGFVFKAMNEVEW
jgi:hypothetical protein